MSESNQESMENQADEPTQVPEIVQSPPTEKTPLAPRKKRKGRWLRWLKRGFFGLVILLVLARLALPFALPSILRAVGKSQGLAIAYEKFDLSLLGGAVEIKNAIVRPWTEPEEPVADPIAHLHYLLVDADISALLTGKLKVHRVEIDGVEAWMRRDEAGRWQLEELLAKGEEPGQNSSDDSEEKAKPAKAKSKSKAEPAEAEEPKPIDLTSPVEVSAVLLQRVALHVDDRFLDPPLKTDFQLDVSLTSLGHEELPLQLNVIARCPEVLDLLSVHGEGRSGGPNAEFDLDVEMSSLQLIPLTSYLEPLGLRPRAQHLHADFALSLRAEAANEDGSALAVDLGLTDIALLADSDEAAALDEVRIEASRLSSSEAQIPVARVRGVRAAARRLSDGTLRVAGIDLIPAAPAPPKQAKAEEESEQQAAAPFALEVPKFELLDVALRFHDEGLRPATQLEFLLPELTVGPLKSDASEPALINLAAGAPGLFQELKVTGQAQPFGSQLTFDLDLGINGIAPEAAASYLAAAGIESTFEDGSFEAKVQGSLNQIEVGEDEEAKTRIEAELGPIRLKDESDLLALDRLTAQLELDPATATTRIEAVELTGTRLSAERDKDGVLHLLGLAIGAVPPTPQTKVVRAEAPTPAQDDAPQAPKSTPVETPARIVVDRVAWTDSVLRWRDATLQPEFGVRLDDLGLELENLVLGGDESAPREAASLRTWFASEAIGEEIRLEGTILSQPGPLDLRTDMRVDGRGLDLAKLQPYLEGLGLEEQWEAAELGLRLVAEARQQEETLFASAELTELNFRNGEREWLALDSLSVPGVRVADAGIEIDAITIRQPRLHLERDEEGGLAFFGLRVAPVDPNAPAAAATPTEKKTVQAAPLPPVVPPAGSGAGSAGSEGEVQAEPDQAADVLRLAGLTLEGTQVTWTDRFLEPTVETEVGFGIEVGELVVGKDAPNTTFDIALNVRDSLERLGMKGSLQADPLRPRLQAELGFEGLRAGPLEPYLPPGLELTLVDGRLQAQFEVAVDPASEGGQSVSVQLQGLDYRDGQAPQALLAMQRLAFVAPRLDPEAKVFDVSELVVEGLELDAFRTTPTRVELLGIALDQPEERTAALQLDPAGPKAKAAAWKTATPKATLPAAQAAPTLLPTVTIDKLDLGLARLGFLDQTRQDSVPLVANLALRAPGPLTLISPEAEDLPPIELLVEGAAQPVVGSIDSKIVLDPWNQEPGANLTLDVQGIRGAGLTELVPDLIETLDGRGLENGRFTTEIDAHLRVRKRGPVEFDFESGFGFDLAIEDIALRDGEGDVLLGLEAIFVDAKSVRPTTGDVYLQSIEIIEPQGWVRRTPEGLHAAGLLLRTPAQDESVAPEAEVETEEEAEAEEQVSEGEEVPPLPEPSAEPPPEFRFDRLIVSGIDFRFQDETFQPAMVMPLNGLDLEVKRFSTKALTEDRPIQAKFSLYAGSIELPERREGTLVGGTLGALGSVVTGENKYAVEERPAFDEIRGSANLSLYPQASGTIRASVRGMELQNFAGPAKQGGVDIGDGLLNETLTLNLRADGSVRLDSDTKLSYLSLTEPPGGPISKYLKLPAPLGTVLFVLKNEEGDINLPISFSMPQGQVSLGKVASTASALLLDLIANAIASSPMRIVGGVLDLAGLEEDNVVMVDGIDPVRLEFLPGISMARPEQTEALEPLLAAMAKDPTLIMVLEHELGGGDLSRAEALANPSPEDCRAIADNLRARKASLLLERQQVSARATAAFAIGDTAGGEGFSTQLRSLDSELGRVEVGLDQVFDRLRPGAERGRAKRTRRAALELAEGRLQSLEGRVRDLPITAIGRRIDARRPRFQKAEGEAGGVVTATLRRRR